MIQVNDFVSNRDKLTINALYLIESERSKLDPLPEEKSTVEQTYKRVYPDWKPSTALEKTDVVGTLEAIEDAQTTANNQSRDKSAWRKSNLNTTAESSGPGTDDNESYARRVMRQRSRDSVATATPNSSPLHSIIEEDRRKSVIQQLGERSASDRLHIYIRRPSDSPESIDNKTPSNSTTPIDKPMPAVAITSDHHSIYIRPPTIDSMPVSGTIDGTGAAMPIIPPTTPTRFRRPLNSGTGTFSTKTALPLSSPPKDDSTNNKIEIDSDNIETPPSTRRNINIDTINNATKSPTSNPCRKLQAPRPLHKQTIADNAASVVDSPTAIAADDPDVDSADIQFDRHSSTRRTRRYKRPTDYSSGNDDAKSNKVSELGTNADHVDTPPKLSPPNSTEGSTLELTKIALSKAEDKDERLRRWQDKLKLLDRSDDQSIAKVITRVGKMGRNMSSINQEDVREAIRNLKSPTETPDRVWSPPREIIKDKASTTKVSSSNHELNDEGFEETQSLVSDTPSHGKESTSSCNEHADMKVTTPKQRVRPLRMTSSDSATTNTSSDTSKKKNVSKPYVQSLLERNRQSLERSRSLRVPATAASTVQRTILPKRTNSLRKTDSQSSVGQPTGSGAAITLNKRDVERSSSRTSLRSSRSSLNSAASTNTVKNVGGPLKATAIPRSASSAGSIGDHQKIMYNKKPFALQNNASNNNVIAAVAAASTIGRTTRMPASRSSSSGSSIGATVRKPIPRQTSTGSSISTSFKENHTTNSPRIIVRNTTGSSNNSSRVSSPPISSMAAKVTARLTSTQSLASSSPPPTQSSNVTPATKISRVSNFMRPTTSSATKFSGPKGK